MKVEKTGRAMVPTWTFTPQGHEDIEFLELLRDTPELVRCLGINYDGDFVFFKKNKDLVN